VQAACRARVGCRRDVTTVHPRCCTGPCAGHVPHRRASAAAHRAALRTRDERHRGPHPPPLLPLWWAPLRCCCCCCRSSPHLWHERCCTPPNDTIPRITPGTASSVCTADNTNELPAAAAAATGDAVNTASRMESSSSPGQVQVSAEAHELLKVGLLDCAVPRLPGLYVVQQLRGPAGLRCWRCSRRSQLMGAGELPTNSQSHTPAPLQPPA
jgi:hypothetical protein